MTGSSRSGSGRSVSLVLGSGGARGLAHIGAIRAIEASGYKIASITGSSIGALIGGIHAKGSLDAYEQWVTSINKVDMVRLLDLSLRKGGLVKGDRLIAHLRELVGEQQIEDLPIRYTAVATDIDRQREVWIDRGPLFNAIRASISLPFFFLPYRSGRARLVDGGVTNPLPIAPTFRDDSDLTIAVNLAGPADPRIHEKDPEEQSTLERWAERLHLKAPDLLRRGDGVYDISMRCYEIMQETLVRHKLAAYPPDLVIEIPRNACSPLGYDEAERLIDLGRKYADEALETLAR